MADPRDDFLAGIDFAKIEVREYPKIAFLCGGVPDPLADHATGNQYFPSFRSYISRSLTANYSSLRYQNAEDVKDWNSYSAYEDLIEFEKDIAHICKAIVLFVESPGSLAELGAFAIIPEITEKLIVFVHSDFSESMSFVSLGPLKRISDTVPDRVHYVTWSEQKVIINSEAVSVVQPDSVGEWGKYTCEAINSLLEERYYIDHSSDKYARTKEALFIHDIVGNFKAVTRDELAKYLKAINHVATENSIRRSVFCLEKLDLVRPVTRGNKTFFVLSDPSSRRYLNLNSRVDSVRLAIQLDDYYKHPAQLARRDAISDMLGGAV